ncbi:MAG: hypothetical protein LQ338_008196, partial [Usnochroma carphineum]
NEDDQKLAKKALRWVAYTYKPLSPNALREALAIEPGETDFDNEALSLIGMILDVCAGLLILDEENDIVRLVHYTAQDYFDAVQISRFHKVHATIASDCINYLSYDCFQCPEGPSHHIIEATPGMPRDSTSAPPTYFYFLEYASVFWVKHAMANRDSKLSVRIHKFLAGNPRIILDKVVRSYGRMTTDRLRTRHGLEIAVFFGLCDYLEGLFKDIGEAHLLLDGLFLLHLAARDDQVTAVEVLVDHGANKERRDPDGLTPLHCAIERDALKAATALVNRGADVMAVASDGLTPIASVRAISPASFLELLLKAGVKIRTRDISDETPLMRQLIKTDDVNTAKRLFEQHSLNEPTEKPLFSKALLLASHLGSMGIIDMLLDYGADINSKDQSDQTALHLASSKSELACIKLLLARGADTEAQDKCGRTSLFHAAEWGHEDCLFTFLCNGANVNAQDDFGTTALLMASKNGRLVALKLLLAHGANTEARDTLGRTSLFYAAREGNEECLLALLRNGADVNAQDDFGTTALHMASKNGELIAVELLLEHGANPEAQDDKGRTSLFYAAQKGDEDSLLVLLRNGADVNVQDEHGMTALHMTSAQGNLTMTQELVEHHATIVIRSRSVLTKYLRSARSWQDRPFGIHCFDVKDDLWAQITCLGPPDLRDLKGIISERKELLELRVWKDGVTALDIATFCGRDKIVRLLNSSAESATESHPVSFEDYLFDLLGISSVEEAEEELDRRIEKENKGGWRKVQWGFPKGRN